MNSILGNKKLIKKE